MTNASDMSKQHEAWVVDVLNFLNLVEAPIYRHNDLGEKQGEPYDIPMRLKWVAEQLSAQKRETLRVRADRTGEIAKIQDRIEDLERVLNLAYDALVPDEGPCRTGEAIMLLDNVLNPGEPGIAHANRVKYSHVSTDELGVRRVKIDGRAAFLMIGADGIIHDLNEDEEICPQCSGLGLCKVESRYGKGNRKPHEPAFPYKHEWLAQCPQCYMGKVRVCQEPADGTSDAAGLKCGKIVPRGRTVCNCPAAVSKLAERRAAKEAERRSKLPRVKLAAYDVEMVFGIHTERFVKVDDAGEHLDEYPEDEFFACRPGDVQCRIDAADIVEMIKDRAYDDAGPDYDDQPVDFSSDAIELLDKVLDAWFAVCVHPERLYWVDSNRIVEVIREG